MKSGKSRIRGTLHRKTHPGNKRKESDCLISSGKSCGRRVSSGSFSDRPDGIPDDGPGTPPGFRFGILSGTPGFRCDGNPVFPAVCDGRNAIPFPEEILFFGFGKGDFECLVPAGVHDPFRRLRIGIDKGFPCAAVDPSKTGTFDPGPFKNQLQDFRNEHAVFFPDSEADPGRALLCADLFFPFRRKIAPAFRKEFLPETGSATWRRPLRPDGRRESEVPPRNQDTANVPVHQSQCEAVWQSAVSLRQGVDRPSAERPCGSPRRPRGGSVRNGGSPPA